MPLETAVGFLVFNRPDLTSKVFDAIAAAKPRRLFIIADGPRAGRPDDAELCERTREIVQRVDWDCELRTDFAESNLGCGRREATGFDWVFTHAEEAIFLEDDTLPDPSFFGFCEAMLSRYRDEPRVMHINGDNSANPGRGKSSYYFSKYMHGWGWASWRRAWQHYDYRMRGWPAFRDAGRLAEVCSLAGEQAYWTSIFDQMHADPQVIDTWDYQWMFAIWAQRGLVIEPRHNLISNLGFGRADAAHTSDDSFRAALPTRSVFPLVHPPALIADEVADARTFQRVFGGEHPGGLLPFARRIASRLAATLRSRQGA